MMEFESGSWPLVKYVEFCTTAYRYAEFWPVPCAAPRAARPKSLLAVMPAVSATCTKLPTAPVSDR